MVQRQHLLLWTLTTAMLMTLAKAATTSGARAAPSKDFWILRHGQATHNPRAEAARENGCSFDEFIELMRQDDSLDSELTALGRQQAQSVYEQHANNPHFARLDLVVSSPLSRAMQTADLAAPAATIASNNRVLYEDFREINGMLLNAQRKSKTSIQNVFPSWNLQHLEHEQDVFWTQDLETTEKCRERGYQGLQWILQRPENNILLVAHGGILRYTMTEHERVQVKDGRTNTGNSSERHVKARFGNCELRRYRIEWGVSSTCTTASDTSNEQHVVLTEVDFDHQHAVEANGEQEVAAASSSTTTT